MRVVVVYESMYGNTHLIADAVADGLRAAADVVVVPVGRATPELVAGADLLVVGGPTHAHGMVRPATRQAAVEGARKPESGLRLDPDAEGATLRDWLSSPGPLSVAAVAFDTRIRISAVLSGRASKHIAKLLRQRGCRLVAEPESFFVTKENCLDEGEEDRAREWGAQLVARAAA